MIRPLILLLVLAGCAADADGDGYSADVDCNDGDPAVNPDATEVCDGRDNDCDGTTDVDAEDGIEAFADLDEDGFGGALTLGRVCVLPRGFVEIGGDCDDLDAAAHPDATEICDGRDTDCDGAVDDADDSVDPASHRTFFADEDGDGYGVDEPTARACAPPDGFATQAGDCDDADPDRSPATPWYADLDGDGFAGILPAILSCTRPTGLSAVARDCDDRDRTIFPGAVEVCNGADDDCDGAVDDEDPSVDPSTFQTFYRDTDGDDWGVEAETAMACAPPAGFAAGLGDCAPDDAGIHPGATEICDDGIDQDCNGTARGCALVGAYTEDDADHVWEGDAVDSRTGAFLLTLDHDGDGIQDALVAAPRRAPGVGRNGRVHLRYGGPAPADRDVPDDLDASLQGGFDERLGDGLFDAGDLNGDGRSELLVRSALAFDEGEVSLFPGSATRLAADWTSDDAVLRLTGAPGAALGTSALAGHDLDDDGYEDLALGAPGASAGDLDGQGAVYLLYGEPVLAELPDSLGALDRILGDAAGDRFGLAQAAGDVDGDGAPDVAIGAPGVELGGPWSGEDGLLLLWRASEAELVGTTLASEAPAQLEGDQGEQVGSSVQIGDLDGDGYEDLVVGSPAAGSRAEGRVDVIPGALDGPDFSVGPGDAAAWSVEGSEDFEQFGELVWLPADLDQDGGVDLVLGSPTRDSGGEFAVGEVLIFYTGQTRAGVLSGANADARILGGARFRSLGQSVAAGDLDDNGTQELLIGAPGSRDGIGRVLVFSIRGL